eukprot:gene13639-13194_t
MTSVMNRLPVADRRRLLFASLRQIRRRYPKYAKQIDGIAALILKRKAPQSSMLSALNVLLGSEELQKLFGVLRHAFIAFKIRKRAFRADACLCHGCFSYPSVVTCEACGQVAFCYGCLDYGACDACSAR